jgi:tRNA A37 threonylcarbamoyladenosine dehydratase
VAIAISKIDIYLSNKIDVTDIGANTESLARSGFGKLTVVDRDRIEERNLSTQP